jgi:activating signal cointegrator 1
MIGSKTFETCRWSTSYRGTLGIHASDRYDDGQHKLVMQKPYRSVLRAAGYVPTQLPLGAVLGTVELVEIIPTHLIWCERGFLRNGHTSHAHLISRQEWILGDYNRGRFAWKLANPQPYPEPMPLQEFLGLWEWLGDASAYETA